MNWFLILLFFIIFLSFIFVIIILFYLFDIKGGKDIIFLIDWIYDNVKYVIFVGVCLFLIK